VASGAPMTIGFSAAGAMLAKLNRKNTTATMAPTLFPSLFLIFPLLENLQVFDRKYILLCGTVMKSDFPVKKKKKHRRRTQMNDVRVYQA
jgi:hypothetical protein